MAESLVEDPLLLWEYDLPLPLPESSGKVGWIPRGRASPSCQPFYGLQHLCQGGEALGPGETWTLDSCLGFKMHEYSSPGWSLPGWQGHNPR